jgi:2'-5' RNA ligase
MRIRAFLALSFSLPVTRRIADEAAKLKAPFEEAGLRVTWVPAANLHVTLLFLGGIEEELVEGIAGRLRRVAAGIAPFEMRARGWGAFPSLERPRVLWAGVDAGPALGELAKGAREAMLGLGIALDPDDDKRGFHPHVTVGRVKDGHGPVPAVFREAGGLDFGSSAASEIVVYESAPVSRGVEYRVRARVPLGASPASASGKST